MKFVSKVGKDKYVVYDEDDIPDLNSGCAKIGFGMLLIMVLLAICCWVLTNCFGITEKDIFGYIMPLTETLYFLT